MWKFIGAGAGALAGLMTAVACSGTPDDGLPRRSGGEASSAAAATPPYRLEVTDKRYFDVYVDKLYPAADLRRIVADLQQRHADQEDGYFVRINCSTGGTSGADNRLANAKFAVGPLGAARTGLDEGKVDFEIVDGAQCPVILPSAAGGAVSAGQVIDAFAAAGLPVNAPRDNSGKCQSLGCSTLITTDDVSVYQFPDAESAGKWADALADSGYRSGSIVLRFNIGGSDPTDPAAIPEYRDVLAGLGG